MPMPKWIFDDSDGDPWIPVSGISALIREETGHPGPGHRALTQRANSALLSPPMERRRDFWGIKRSRVPELITKLRSLGLLGGIDRHALDVSMRTYWLARQAGLDHDAAVSRSIQEIEGGAVAITTPGTDRQQRTETAEAA